MTPSSKYKDHPFYELLKVFEEFDNTPMMIAFNKNKKREERKKKINRILKNEKIMKIKNGK